MSERICHNHFSDQVLIDRVWNSDVRDETCGYCDEVAPTLPIWEIAQLIDSMIDQFYQATTGYEDDGEPIDTDDGEPLADLVEKECGLTDDALEDMCDALLVLWSDRDTHEMKHGDEPRFVDRRVFGAALDSAWRAMEESLRHEARIINPKASETLRRVFGPLAHDSGVDGEQGVVVEIGPGTEREKVYRARTFLTLNALEADMKHPERSIGPPPQGAGASGRMNAQGVSVFYGAFDPAVALAEVRPPVGSHVVVAGFKLLRKVRLLDITRLGPSRITGSKFDRNTVELHERSGFLGTLKQRLILPVMPGQEESGYLITQAVADYLSMEPSLDLDGIMFPSVQHGGGGADGTNVILFNKAASVDRAGSDASKWSDFDLWDFDEHVVRLAPTLVTRPLPPHERGFQRMAFAKPTLELDRGDVSIHRITGVSYVTSATPVESISLLAME